MWRSLTDKLIQDFRSDATSDTKHDLSRVHTSSESKFIALIWCYATLAIIAVQYLKNYSALVEATYWLDFINHNFKGSTLNDLKKLEYFQLLVFFWWWLWQLLFYFIVPMVILKFYCKLPLNQFGWRFSLRPNLNKYYVFWFIATLLIILMISNNKNLNNYYPLYKLANHSWHDFIFWEILYLSHFLFIEFFFRGLLVTTLSNRIGLIAIFVVATPYVMIHLEKPWLEALASLPFGLFLGYMVIRTKSILSGVILHVAIALSLDLNILITNDSLPKNF